MLRLVFIVIRFFFDIPSVVHAVHYQKKHRDEIPLAKRIDWTRRLLKKATKRARVDLTVSGTENLPAEGGYLITPNHQGMFDIVALFDAIERPFKIVYKVELRKIGLVADTLDNMEYQGIDRENLRQSIKVIRATTKDLKAGMPVVIFPEGTRSKQGNSLNEFKGGSFKSAIDAKVPIVPCAMVDCFKVLDYNSLKKVHCQIHFFKPIPYEEYQGLSSTEIADRVSAEIQNYINEHD